MSGPNCGRRARARCDLPDLGLHRLRHRAGLVVRGGRGGREWKRNWIISIYITQVKKKVQKSIKKYQKVQKSIKKYKKSLKKYKKVSKSTKKYFDFFGLFCTFWYFLILLQFTFLDFCRLLQTFFVLLKTFSYFFVLFCTFSDFRKKLPRFFFYMSEKVWKSLKKSEKV